MWWYVAFLLSLLIMIIIKSFLKKYNKKSLIKCIELLMFLQVFIFSGFRYNIGYDYTSYTDRILTLYQYGDSFKRELFSYYLMKLAYDFGNPQIFFMTNSFITISLFFLSLKRYSEDFELSLWIFICFPLFFLNSLSVVRSFSAISIILYAYKYIDKKNFIRYCIAVFIAAMFHNTAVICIVLYWIGDIKINRLLSIILLSLSLVIEPVVTYLFMRIFPTYSVYIHQGSMDAGTKTILVLWAIMIFALIFRDRLVLRNKINNFHYNSLLIGIMFYTMLIRYGTIAHRGTLYMYISILYLLPRLLNVIPIHDKTLLKVIVYITFIPMYIYMLKIGGESYVPYKFFNN